MIEKHWLDKTIYYVGFLVEYNQLKNEENFTKYKIINEMLVLSMELSEIEVQEIVLLNFDNVVEVLFVDELNDVLLLR